eukprot:scaffold2990_cov119-Isochrysis_galbana.AAC.2
MPASALQTWAQRLESEREREPGRMRRSSELFHSPTQHATHAPRLLSPPTPMITPNVQPTAHRPLSSFSCPKTPTHLAHPLGHCTKTEPCCGYWPASPCADSGSPWGIQSPAPTARILWPARLLTTRWGTSPKATNWARTVASAARILSSSAVNDSARRSEATTIDLLRRYARVLASSSLSACSRVLLACVDADAAGLTRTTWHAVAAHSARARAPKLMVELCEGWGRPPVAVASSTCVSSTTAPFSCALPRQAARPR